MGRISSETESPISSTHDDASMRFDRSIDEQWPFVSQTSMKDSSTRKGLSRSGSKLKKKNPVLLEGYVEGNGDENDLGRTKSLTDDDLDELKGCVDLGFGFSYDEIPELCSTLPALELCYSMSQKFGDDSQKSPDRSSESTDSASESTASPIASWRISGPGDHPEDVKARLKFWAQAVACTVRLCS